MRYYPKGSGAGISLVVLILLGVFGISQFDNAKRASFEEGFQCANDASTRVVHSSHDCKEYRAQRKTNPDQQRNQ